MPVTVESFRNALETFIGGSPLFVFLPAAFILLLFDRTKKHRKQFAAAVLILILVLYNPVTYRLYDRFVDRNTYYRLFWILPCAVAMGYVLIRLVSFLPRPWMRALIVLAVCVPLLYLKAGPSTFFLPYSVYQVPVETVFIGDRMNAIMDEAGMSESMLLCDEDIAFTIRTYTARALLPTEPRYYTSGHIVKWQNGSNLATLMTQLRYNDVEMPLETAQELIKKYDIHFISVFRYAESATSYLEKLGFKSAGVCRDRELFYRLDEKT